MGVIIVCSKNVPGVLTSGHKRSQVVTGVLTSGHKNLGMPW